MAKTQCRGGQIYTHTHILKQQAKWWSRHKGINIVGKPEIEKQANTSRSQQGHKTAGKLLQKQAEWQSCHKGIDIVGKLNLWTASPSGLGQQGC
jgi:hypothetical protein